MSNFAFIQISKMERGLSLNDYFEMEGRKKFHSGWYSSREASELRYIIREEIVELFVAQSKSDEDKRKIQQSDGMYERLRHSGIKIYMQSLKFICLFFYPSLSCRDEIRERQRLRKRKESSTKSTERYY